MAALADCGSGSVGTCLSSLFIMKHNCLENLSHNVYSNESSNLSDAKCLTLDEKAYFSSSRELVAADDGVLSACKSLHDSPDSAICTLGSPEDSDDFKKKRCMDRYDSSESSDSGVLTGSTCSESSSNSGNSDITDPCSPYSVTFFHLGDDNGSPLPLPSKSSSFSSSDLLTASKMLPENINREEENDVSCWAWDKTIDWNERYELTSEDIDVEVKDSVYFDSIDEKHDEENDLEHNIKIRPGCYPEDHENKTAVSGKLNFTVPMVERKHLNAVNGFRGKELSARKCCKSGLRAVNKDTSSTDCSKDFALPNNVLNIDATSANYFYEKVFQQKRVASPASAYGKIPTAESEILRVKPQENDKKSSDITAIESDDNDIITNKCFSFNSYPIEFFNILPSVFKGPIIYSANDDVDEDNACESLVEKSRTAVVDHDAQKEQELQCTAFDTRRTRSDNQFCKTNSLKDVPDDTVVCSHNNNNNNNNFDKNNIILKKPVLRTLKSQDTLDSVVNIDSLPNVDPSPGCREQTRFPTERKSSFYSERICRWSDCVDHVSSSAKLVEHLQTKHVNPQTFSGTFICLWNGCKVFGRPSCSRTFLERHVLSHGGNKPYRCIVDNCGQRFSSQLMLERHVNQHFKTPKEINDGFVDATPKLIRRNGQKLRYRRQPYTARNRGDAFDASIMAHLHYLLVQMARRSNTVSLNIMDSKEFLHITFQPKVIGSRRERDGKTKYLVRWYPYNSLEDEWLSRAEAEKNKTIPIWELPASVQQMFWNSMFPKQTPAVRQPRKYKPESRKI